MRERKFRVWNGFEMIYDVLIGKFGIFYVNPSNNGLDLNDAASISPLNTKYHENTPIMEYVCKDKNNIDLYEGDLIKATNYSFQHLNKYIYEIYYDEDSLRFKLRNNKKFPDNAKADMSTFHSFEKVGTIYENPELL